MSSRAFGDPANGVNPYDGRVETEQQGTPLRLLVHKLRWTAIFTGTSLALIGAVNLAARWAGYMSVSHLSMMTTNAAFCLLLSGAAIVLLAFFGASAVKLWSVFACATMVFLIGTLNLSENLLRWNFPVGQFSAIGQSAATGAVSPNRMSTPASLGFALTGLALLLFTRPGRRALMIAQYSALGVLTVGMLGTIGFIYDVRWLYTLTPNTTAPVCHAVIAMLLLGFAMLCVRSADGLTTAVVADNRGGRVIRRLLPWCLAVPVTVGYLRLLGERRGIYSSYQGTAIVVLLLSLVSCFIVYQRGTAISRNDDSELRAKQALTRQAALIDLSPDAIIVRDLSGTVRFWSKGAETLYGWSKEEAIHQNAHHLLRTESKERLETLIRQLQNGHDWKGELVQQKKNGEKIVVRSSWHGKMIGREFEILESNLDITERKSMELSLRASEERFRTMADAIPQLAWIARADGWVYWYNRRCYEYTGTTLEQVEGWGWQSVLDPEVLPAVLERWKNSIETGEPFDMVYRIRGADGILRPFLTRVMPLKDEHGSVMQWFGTNTDISEQQRTEEALAAAKLSAERAKAAAEQANRAKDHFLAVLSHELRMPLTPVVMGISILQSKPDLDRSVRETLETVRGHAEMEGRLIDDLLDVMRIESGKIELHRTPVELSVIIQRAVDICKPDIEARRLHFGVDMGKGAEYWVQADAARLQQVLWNLLKNSVKFTPHGGCVGIRCRPDNNHVLVEVNDTGVGIRPESLSSIFNAFEQAGQNRRFGGLGLGLTISKALVEMHDGTITAYSKGLGKGASFTIELPLTAPVQLDISEKVDALQGIRPLHILLVEDHGVSAKIISQVLTAEGHRVEIEGAVADALEESDRQPFDLLLSDLGLPDGTGYELLEQLHSRGYNFPAIALSGYGQEDDIRRSYQAGFTAHLTKPVSRERLIEVVASVASPGPPKKIRVLLVDDHETFRRGVARILRAERDVEIAGEAGDGESAVNLSRDIRPDVILMDIYMPRMDGIQATKIIHQESPEIRVIALSMKEGSEGADAMKEAGAVSYLTKAESSPETMLATIRASA